MIKSAGVVGWVERSADPPILCKDGTVLQAIGGLALRSTHPTFARGIPLLRPGKWVLALLGGLSLLSFLGYAAYPTCWYCYVWLHGEPTYNDILALRESTTLGILSELSRRCGFALVVLLPVLVGCCIGAVAANPAQVKDNSSGSQREWTFFSKPIRKFGRRSRASGSGSSKGWK